MENNKNVLRYISCACFGVCTLLTFSQLIDYFRYSFPYYPLRFAFADYMLLIAAMVLVIVALITQKQMLLLVGGGVGVLYSIIQLFFNVRNFFFIHNSAFIGKLGCHSCHGVNGKKIWEDTGDYRRSCLGHKQNNINDYEWNVLHRQHVCDEIPLVYHLFSCRYSPAGTGY